MARRRGAVAQAVAEGARAQSAEEGLEELIGLAEAAGPPEVPEDLGNFPAPEPARTRGAARANRRAEGRASVTPIRRPRHLPNFDDERLSREVAGEQAAPARSVPRQPGLPTEEDLAFARAVGVGRRAAEAPEPEEEDEDVAEEPFEEATADEDLDLDDPRDRELYELRQFAAEAREREASRDAELAAIRAELSQRETRASAPPFDANHPAVQQALRGLSLPHLINFAQLDEQFLREHGFTPEQGDGLRKAIGVGLLHGIRSAIPLFALNEQLKDARTQQVMTAQATHRQITDAFYAANPDLVDFADIVTWKSQEVAQRYGLGPQKAAEWMTLSSRAVREHLRQLGVNVGLRAPVTNGTRERLLAERNGRTIPPPVAYRRGRVLPAEMDAGGSRGGFRTGNLKPVEKDILDLARIR